MLPSFGLVVRRKVPAQDGKVLQSTPVEELDGLGVLLVKRGGLQGRRHLLSPRMPAEEFIERKYDRLLLPWASAPAPLAYGGDLFEVVTLAAFTALAVIPSSLAQEPCRSTESRL